MLIGTFSTAEQLIEVSVVGNGLRFRDIGTNELLAPNFSYIKVINQFPDLKDDKDWQVKAGQRFIEYYNKIENDMKKLNYIKDELVKQGYKPEYMMRKGFRPRRFK